MKWIKKIKKVKSRRFKIEHHMFGELLLVQTGNPDEDYWEGEMVMLNMTENLGLAIEAPPAGPNMVHEEFLRKVVENFPDLIVAIKPLLQPAFEQAAGKPYPDNFPGTFTWCHLTIPRDGNRLNPWDVSFEVEAEENLIFTIYFERGGPSGLTIDT